MIHKYKKAYFGQVLSVINDGARAYKGIIPKTCWHEPYMSGRDLKKELGRGVKFYVFENHNKCKGVMGIQFFDNVTLIRHAYVKKEFQKKGIGTKLLKYLLKKTHKPILIGTWADTPWSIRFYEKHNFKIIPDKIKNKLLGKYWKISNDHRSASIVLANEQWYDQYRCN